MELRLATFNLQNLGVRPGEETPELRAWLPEHVAALRQMLRRADADAVAFQEVLDPALLAEVLEGLGYTHLALSEPGASPLRVGVCSRYPLGTPRPVADRIDLDLSEGDRGLTLRLLGAFSRPALEVTWSVPGLELGLFVVHWKSKIPSAIGAGGARKAWESLGQVGQGRLFTDLKRLAQAVEVRRAVDRRLRRDPGACLAVLGDFNDGLDSEGVRIVRGDARAARAPHLAPFELVPCELAIPADLRFTQIFRGSREMLDHVLVSQALFSRFVGARALNEDLADTEEAPPPPRAPARGEQAGWIPDPFRPGSDHAPLVATFRI